MSDYDYDESTPDMFGEGDSDGIVWGDSSDEYFDLNFRNPDEFKNKFSSFSLGGVYKTPYKAPEDILNKFLTPKKSIQDILNPGDPDSEDYFDFPESWSTILKMLEILKFQNDEISSKLALIEKEDKKRKAREWYALRKRKQEIQKPRKKPPKKTRWKKVLPKPRTRWIRKIDRSKLSTQESSQDSTPEIEDSKLVDEVNTTVSNTEYSGTNTPQKGTQIEDISLQSNTSHNKDHLGNITSPYAPKKEKAPSERKKIRTIREEYKKAKKDKKIRKSIERSNREKEEAQKKYLKEQGVPSFSTSSSE